MHLKRYIVIGAIGWLLTANLLSCRSSNLSSPSGVVFFAGNESQGALYFYQFSDGNIRPLTPSGEWVASYYPRLISWSERAQRFVYTTGYDTQAEIHTLSFDGVSEALTHNQWEDHSPQWSPAGSTIAFLSRQTDGMLRAYIMNPASGETRPVSRDESILSADFRWSPKGEKIALLGTRLGEQPEFSQQIQPLGLYIIDVETGEVILERKENGVSFDKPSWSPDGRKLAYVAHTSHRHELRIWDLERNVSYSLIQRGDVWLVEWAPDGTSLAFIAGEVDHLNPNLHIYVVNVEDAEIHDVTPAGVSVVMARPDLFSPDGSCLLITTYESTKQWGIRMIHWPTARERKVAGDYPFAISLIWVVNIPNFSCESLFR